MIDFLSVSVFADWFKIELIQSFQEELFVKQVRSFFDDLLEWNLVLLLFKNSLQRHFVFCDCSFQVDEALTHRIKDVVVNPESYFRSEGGLIEIEQENVSQVFENQLFD